MLQVTELPRPRLDGKLEIADVNEGGDWVGRLETAPGVFRGLLSRADQLHWLASGQPTLLNNRGDYLCAAGGKLLVVRAEGSQEILQAYGSALNELGEVAGAVDCGLQKYQALFCGPGEVRSLEGLPAFDSSFGRALDERQQVVGSCGKQAARWQNQGPAQLLELGQPMVFSEAYAINRRGQIAGLGWPVGGVRQLWTWTSGPLKPVYNLSAQEVFQSLCLNDHGHLIAFLKHQKEGMRAILHRDGKTRPLHKLLPADFFSEWHLRKLLRLRNNGQCLINVEAKSDGSLAP